MLRYVLPGLASITGIAAWLIASNQFGDETDDLILSPDDPYPPITVQINIPEIPMNSESEGGLELKGQVTCLEDSLSSAKAIRCREDEMILDPCYWPPEPGITSVFCFEPFQYRYEMYEVVELDESIAVIEERAVPTFIFVKSPERENINDYSEELVPIGNGFADACTLQTDSLEGQETEYNCTTGSTVTGEILGESPHHFVQYEDSETGLTTSQYLNFIIYG